MFFLLLPQQLLYIIFNIYIQKKNEKEVKKTTLLRIRHTLKESESKSPQQEIEMFKDSIQSIVPSNKSISFEVAIPYEEKSIFFFLSIPAEYAESVKTQIRRIYTNAEMEEVDDYTIFSPKCEYVIYEIKQKEFFGLPIKTYEKENTDVFSAILGAFSSASDTDVGITLQYVIQAEQNNKSGRIRTIVSDIKRGKSFKQATKIDIGNIIENIIEKPSKDVVKETSETDTMYISRLEEKVEERMYRVNIRLAVATSNRKKNYCYSRYDSNYFFAFFRYRI